MTGLTVTVKDWETVLLLTPPSFTVTLMVAEPLPLLAGVNVRVPVVFGLV